MKPIFFLSKISVKIGKSITLLDLIILWIEEFILSLCKIEKWIKEYSLEINTVFIVFITRKYTI